MFNKELVKSVKTTSGDTIIEVILCIAVLGMTMAVAYASASHSLQVATDAGNRDRAVGYMQQQIELIKLAERERNTNMSSYITNPNKPFCINLATGDKIDADSSGACQICADPAHSDLGITYSSGSCASGTNSVASISIIYNDTTKIFTADAKWDAPNGSGQSQSVAYYKLPNAFSISNPAPACAPGQFYDVVVTMDSSSSMTGPFPSDPTGPTTLQIEKNAAITLVTDLNLATPGDRAGAIQFNSTVKVLSNLTTDLTALTNSINNMGFNFGTNYVPALDASNTLLNASPSSNHKVLVFMSDGIANDSKATILSKTAAMQATGIIIYTVGINVDSDPAAQLLLQEMAGGGDSRITGKYSNVSDKASFDKMAVDLADIISC